MKEPNRVDTETTILRLCRAVVSLKRREALLQQFLESRDFCFEEIEDLKNAILDLCGVPPERTSDSDRSRTTVYRDMWADELEGFLTINATEDEFRRAIARMRDLHDVEEITFLPGGKKIEKRRSEKSDPSH